MKKMLVLGISLALAWWGFRDSRSPFGRSHEENVAFLESIAAELNRDLPRRLDAETTLLRVDVTNAGVVNRYQTTTLTNFRMLPPGSYAAMVADLRREVCANRGYRMAMKRGFSISFAYDDPRNIPIETFTFRDGDCIGR